MHKYALPCIGGVTYCKKGDREVVVNCRLISLAGIVCKLLGIIVSNEDFFMAGWNYVNERQHRLRGRLNVIAHLDFYKSK